MTGSVGATVSSEDCLSQGDWEDCTRSVTLVSNDLVVEESDLSVGVFSQDCLSDGDGSIKDCAL